MCINNKYIERGAEYSKILKFDTILYGAIYSSWTLIDCHLWHPVRYYRLCTKVSADKLDRRINSYTCLQNRCMLQAQLIWITSNNHAFISKRTHHHSHSRMDCEWGYIILFSISWGSKNKFCDSCIWSSILGSSCKKDSSLFWYVIL